MAETPCILGQAFPAENDDIDLFIVGPGNQVQCTIFVASHSTGIESITIALIPFGTVTGPYNYIALNTPLSPHACIAFAGIFLNAGDVVRVRSTSGQASFTATGMLMQ